MRMIQRTQNLTGRVRAMTTYYYYYYYNIRSSLAEVCLYKKYLSKLFCTCALARLLACMIQITREQFTFRVNSVKAAFPRNQTPLQHPPRCVMLKMCMYKNTDARAVTWPRTRGSMSSGRCYQNTNYYVVVLFYNGPKCNSARLP